MQRERDREGGGGRLRKAKPCRETDQISPTQFLLHSNFPCVVLYGVFNLLPILDREYITPGVRRYFLFTAISPVLQSDLHWHCVYV